MSLTFRIPSLQTFALLLTINYNFNPANPLTPTALAALTARQPTPNPIDFLDLQASTVYSIPGRVPLSDLCGAGLSAGGLGFPHARFTNSMVGKIDCAKRLVFGSVPEGYAFSVLAVEFEGVVRLNERSWLDVARVGVGYFGEGDDARPSVTDTAVEPDLRHQYYGSWSGTFNLIMNVLPKDGTSRTTRGRTRCAAEDSQPEIELRFSLNSSHGQVTYDDRAMYRAAVSDVRLGFYVMWQRCDS